MWTSPTLSKYINASATPITRKGLTCAIIKHLYGHLYIKPHILILDEILCTRNFTWALSIQKLKISTILCPYFILPTYDALALTLSTEQLTPLHSLINQNFRHVNFRFHSSDFTPAFLRQYFHSNILKAEFLRSSFGRLGSPSWAFQARVSLLGSPRQIFMARCSSQGFPVFLAISHSHTFLHSASFAARVEIIPPSLLGST